ncbi:MAG: beta-glucanase, partial [Bacteroides reticulotermitis]
VYWMITSGCTGWEPNKARLLTATSIFGEWKQLPNPCVGIDADKTFGGQSTYILPIQGTDSLYIFMADMWRPESLKDSRYMWLPIQFDENDIPFIEWKDRWNTELERI